MRMSEAQPRTGLLAGFCDAYRTLHSCLLAYTPPKDLAPPRGGGLAPYKRQGRGVNSGDPFALLSTAF